MKYFIFTFALIGLLVPAAAHAQIDTVNVPPEPGALNDSIEASINAGRLSETVFKLRPDGRYVLTNGITTPLGSTLTIVAPNPGTTQATAPPQILWTPPNPIASRNFIIDCHGDMTLKNLWILYADTDGAQVSTTIDVEDDSIWDLSGAGEHATFDGVIFDYSQTPPSAGGCVTITARNFKGKFENCYFRNDIDPHLRYYGRALSFPYDQPGFHSDSVSFENCTFANLGFVYQQEDADYADYVSFNHCTFVNIMMFTLESGWWKDLAVTNCIFENTYMYGTTPASGMPLGGTIYIDSVSQFGFQVPFTDQQRHILFADNSYGIQPWLVDWMQNNPYSNTIRSTGQTSMIPAPQPMMNTGTLAFFDTTSKGVKLFPYMNTVNVYDSVSPNFIAPPTNIDSIKAFLLGHWEADNTVNWAFEPGKDVSQAWPMEENLAYTNDTLLHAGMGGFPLGDLYHWFPAEYTKWKAQAAQEHQQISNALFQSGTPITPGVSVPVLMSPANADTGLSDLDTLTWSKIAGATGYHLQVSLDPAFNNPGEMAVNDSSITDTSEIIRLGLGTPYYWRVEANSPWSSSGFLNADTFTTKSIAATEVPEQVSPPSGAVNVIPAVRLVSMRTPAASQYRWEVRKDTMFSSMTGFVIDDSTVDTVNTIGTVLPGTMYYWRVQGVNHAGASPFSTVDSFTVMSLPGTPVTVYPGQDAIHILPDTLTLTWHTVQNDSGYVCRVWTNSAAQVPIIQDSTKDTSLTVTKLDKLTRYYWQVAAYNPAGSGGFSQADTFTTTMNTPPSPATIYPSGNSGEPREATFFWKTSASAAKYELQVASNAGFNPVILDTTVTDTLVQVTDTLAADRTYYWRVAGIDAGGTGTFSAAVSFTTGAGVLGIKEIGGIPTHFALLQNYPNPFNPTTTVRFDLRESSVVTLAVYDVLGQQVEEFDLGRMSAGRYSQTVDMSQFASGVYFYRIDAVGADGKSFVSLKKMLMIK